MNIIKFTPKKIAVSIIAAGFSLFSSCYAHFNIVKPYDMKNFQQDISHLYQEPLTHSPSLSLRWRADSEYFLGKPYLLYSTGEGPHAQFDQNPIYRSDGFDCFSFVNTVLALVESNNLAQFEKNIIQMSYQSLPASFIKRNHFTSVDWNTKNQKLGYIEDVTKQLFPNEVKYSLTQIDKPHWYSKMDESRIQLLKDPGEAAKKHLLKLLKHEGIHSTKSMNSKLAYVPLSALYDEDHKPKTVLFDRIPDASIIEIIRPNWDLTKVIGTHLDVSHLGFAYKKDHIIYFREASQIKKKVLDIPLTEYLANYLSSTTIKGINIEKIKLK